MRKVSQVGDGYTTTLQDSKGPLKNRLLIGTAVTGLLRAEWVQARYGQIIPTNWSWVQYWQYVNGYMPLRYQVDDAQNMIAREVVRGDYEWLLLYEHDMLPAPDAMIRLNEYMKAKDVPVVSALYYTRSIPSEPLVYRGRGTGAFQDFMLGDLVWADGVPTGFLLIHGDIIRAMWEESEEYAIGHEVTRRVFHTPNNVWFDPESEQFYTQTGTSDLAWCERVMEGDYFRKAGFAQYADREYPFLIDTNIFCRHINMDGAQFPPPEYMPKRRPEPKPAPPTLGVAVGDGMATGEGVGS